MDAVRKDSVDNVLDGLFLVFELFTASVGGVAGRIQIQVASIGHASAASAHFTNSGKQMSAEIRMHRSLLFRPYSNPKKKKIESILILIRCIQSLTKTWSISNIDSFTLIRANPSQSKPIQQQKKWMIMLIFNLCSIRIGSDSLQDEFMSRLAKTNQANPSQSNPEENWNSRI